MSQIQTIAKSLVQQISDVCMEYFVSYKDKKSDIIIYNTLCWLQESSANLLAIASELSDKDLISSKEYTYVLYTSRLALEKKGDILQMMQDSGLTKNDLQS